METKKYGLIRLSQQNKPINTLKKNIFESDSDEDLESISNEKRVNTSSGIRRQTQLDISRALTDDPNVFEYDSVYEDMKSKKDSIVVNPSEETQKKAKYINSLLKFSENRKKENERRIERKIQKERESEGNRFEDKEQFVTNAYKEKLAEMRAEDQRIQREEMVEELLDVKKQKDLSGFYRHLLNNDMNSQSIDSKPESHEIPKEISKEIPKSVKKYKPKRQFRQRRSSSEESSEDLPQNDKTKDETNVVNSQKTSEKIHKNLEISEQNTQKLEISESESEGNESIDENSNSKQSKQQKESTIEVKEKTNKMTESEKRELLLKKFTKRSVGELYSAAQIRYFERKDKYVI